MIIVLLYLKPVDPLLETVKYQLGFDESLMVTDRLMALVNEVAAGATSGLLPTDHHSHDLEEPMLPPQSSPSPTQSPPQQHSDQFRQVGESDGVPGFRGKNLLSVAFNQDYGCFACGTTTGFRIYNCDPFKETFSRELNKGGIGIVEMLFRCNILAVVGGGDIPQYPPNKVMIWDDHQSRCIGELSFRSDVRAVRLRRDRIVVILEHKIYVYNFVDLKLLHQIETIANPKGLCALSPTSSSPILACPGLHKGQVRVEHYVLRKTKFIPAHDSHLACFCLTLDGKLLATASTKGTLIRIFNTMDGTRLQEVRRGADRAEIFSIAFSSNFQWLAVSSDKGTVHVFSLKIPPTFEDLRATENIPVERTNSNGSGTGSPIAGSPLSGNPGSTLSFMKGVLPKYFSSEWSISQFRLPEEMRTIVAFGPEKNTVIIVGLDGSFYKCIFDGNGGEMVQKEYAKFLKPAEEDLGLT